LILISFVNSDVSYFVFLSETARGDSGDSYMNEVIWFFPCCVISNY